MQLNKEVSTFSDLFQDMVGKPLGLDMHFGTKDLDVLERVLDVDMPRFFSVIAFAYPLLMTEVWNSYTSRCLLGIIRVFVSLCGRNVCQIHNLIVAILNGVSSSPCILVVFFFSFYLSLSLSQS